MLRVAKRAGCRQVFYGVEAGTDDGLRAVKKNLTIAQATKAVQMTRKAGIESSTNWIIGFPHQKSTEDIMELIRTAVKVDSDYAQFNICIAYHGTEIFTEGVKLGLFAPDAWRNYVKSPAPHFAEPVWEEFLSRQELSRLLLICYKRFYMRPRVIFRKMLAIRSLKELKLHIMAALTIMVPRANYRKITKDAVSDTGVQPHGA